MVIVRQISKTFFSSSNLTENKNLVNVTTLRFLLYYLNFWTKSMKRF